MPSEYDQYHRGSPPEVEWVLCDTCKEDTHVDNITEGLCVECYKERDDDE